MARDSKLDVQANRMAERNAGTFKELAEAYLEDQKTRLKSWAQSKYKIDAYLLPRWGTLQAGDITRSDVKALSRNIGSRGSPNMADAVVTQILTIFNWAIKEEWVGVISNPAKVATKRYRCSGMSS